MLHACDWFGFVRHRENVLVLLEQGGDFRMIPRNHHVCDSHASWAPLAVLALGFGLLGASQDDCRDREFSPFYLCFEVLSTEYIDISGLVGPSPPSRATLKRHACVLQERHPQQQVIR